MFKLYISNKNYSSWSLRAYLTLKQCGIVFEEILIPIFSDAWYDWQPPAPLMRQVPLLHDTENDIWISDSLAIALNIERSYPYRLLPSDHHIANDAMMIASEIHSNHTSLRAQMPMNMQIKKQKVELSKDTKNSIKRLDMLISFYCDKYQTEYLCGDYGLADIFLTPIASRFESYDVKISKKTNAYCQKLLKHDFMKNWIRDALKESYDYPKRR